jgi:ATP-dependent RNA circularization protein (DNA/RNA ligase family)
MKKLVKKTIRSIIHKLKERKKDGEVIKQMKNDWNERLKYIQNKK